MKPQEAQVMYPRRDEHRRRASGYQPARRFIQHIVQNQQTALACADIPQFAHNLLEIALHLQSELQRHFARNRRHAPALARQPIHRLKIPLIPVREFERQHRLPPPRPPAPAAANPPAPRGGPQTAAASSAAHSHAPAPPAARSAATFESRETLAADSFSGRNTSYSAAISVDGNRDTALPPASSSGDSSAPRKRPSIPLSPIPIP